MDYFKHIVKSIYKPLKTYEEISYHKKATAWGWYTTLGFAFLYSLTAFILWLNGWVPFAPPTLPLSLESYYLYQTFFTIPVGVVGVGASYFIVLGLLRLFKVNRGEQNLWGTISIASCLPSFFTMWGLETYIAFFVSANNWNYPQFDIIRIIVGSVWTMVLTIIAVQSIKDAKWWKSIIIGILASGVMGTIMAVCYR